MKKLLFISLAFLASFSSYCQPNKVKAADKNYEKLAYVDAIKTYERVFEKGYKSADMLQKLGNAYYFKADLDNAAKWYGELFNFTQDVEPEYYFRYAQSLKAIKEYKKADEMMAKFNEKSGNDQRAKLAAGQKDYLAVIKKNSGRYTIENAGINSQYSDYGSAYLDNKVVFASARDTGGVAKGKHTWTGEGFTNIYSADMGAEGALSRPERFSKNMNSKYHESTPVFTKDGKTVYFTRNNYVNGKKKRDDNKTILLKLLKATLEGDKWTDIKELPFNSDQYSVAHPALSPDDKTLYFASDMPGTTGLSDLWKVAINGDDTYGTPENLGKGINTEGRETFPAITPENELYFASDGQPGLGGLDIYVSKGDSKDGSFKDPINVGEPANSPKDDFALLMDTKTNIGYLTSNREGGLGGDDIYKIHETKKIEFKCEQLLAGTVVDQKDQKPIGNAQVTLMDQNFKKMNDTFTDAEGKFFLGSVECGSKLYLKTVATGYNVKETPTLIAKTSGKSFVPVELEKTVVEVPIGGGLGNALNIKMIYFDLDKSYIRADAAAELAKILAVMEEYPTMEIDIRSHTDCRQTAAYNEALSDRRAKSTRGWLISKGINASRLTAKGYGESQLVNNCPCEPTNESTCTEEQHQENRRSEFIITKM
jgi:outer membrane protein OmpA-like peptidoglycan-associated protein/tetratricopeptide (TPR) repeat protein